MRELKFRAWFEDIGMQYNYNPLHSCDNIMQYTGLKDKNGVEIYEGDIVHWFDGEIGAVVWSDGDCEYMMDDKLIAGFGSFDTEPVLNGLQSSKCRYYKVIGNIYENPELINN